jgi:hypothetical protein
MDGSVREGAKQRVHQSRSDFSHIYKVKKVFKRNRKSVLTYSYRLFQAQQHTRGAVRTHTTNEPEHNLNRKIKIYQNPFHFKLILPTTTPLSQGESSSALPLAWRLRSWLLWRCGAVVEGQPNRRLRVGARQAEVQRLRGGEGRLLGVMMRLAVMARMAYIYIYIGFVSLRAGRWACRRTWLGCSAEQVKTSPCSHVSSFRQFPKS